MSYESTVLADSPTLLWMLDEASGTTAADATGNGHAGTYAGGYAQGSAGPAGVSASAVTLDGTSGYVYLNASLTIGQPFSFECWARTTTAGRPACGGSGAQGASSTYDRELVTQGTSGDAGFYIYGTAALISSTAISDGSWHYLAGTYDGTTMTLYVDGAGAGGKPVTSTNYAGYWLAGRSGGTGGSGLSVTSAFFDGTLSAFAVYPVALTPAQVAAHYNAAFAPSPPSGLLMASII